MNELLNKRLEQFVREAKAIIADPDHHVGYDWEASLDEIQEAQARRRGELPGQPTAEVVEFPKRQSQSDSCCSAENDIILGEDNE